MKSHTVAQAKHQLRHNIIMSVCMLIFKIHGNECDLSMMRISCKLTKRSAKSEKIEKSFKKMNNMKNITTFRN